MAERPTDGWGITAIVTCITGPFVVVPVVAVAALLDQPVGLALGGILALWWAGCVAALAHLAASAPHSPVRGRAARWSWSSLLVLLLVYAFFVESVTLTVAARRVLVRGGPEVLDFGEGGHALLAVGQALGWVAFALAVLGPVTAGLRIWLRVRCGRVSDPPPPAGP